MSDVNAAATLSLAISTGDAADEFVKLKTAYAELKGEFAKGLPSTGISKEATAEINNLKAAIAGYEAKNRDLNSQVQLLTDRFKDFSAAAKSSAATMSAGLSGVAVKARADLKEIGDTYSGAVNKILAERQRLASKGIDFGSSVKGLELVQKSTTENTKELAKYIKALEVAKAALKQLDAPELLKQKHGDTILAEIAKLDAYKAQLASALNVRSRVNSYAPMYADDYAAEQKAAANLLALKAQTASQQNIENAAIAKEIELQQRLNSLNEKGLAEARLKANLALRQQETEELRKQEVLLAARQRASVSYLSGTPRQQAAQVVRASVAFERGYDTAGYAAEALAAAQNVEKLAAAKAVLAPATRAATVEQHNWNKAAKDGHAFARGLSGSLGALWMTYGNLVPLMAGAALAGGFKQAITAGSEFAYQLTFVKALGGETAQAVAQIGASALELSKTSMYGPGELANGLRMLSQAGLSARDSLSALPVAMNLATVGEMSMEQATLTLVGVMNAFGMGVTDLTHIGDMFSKAAALSQTSVSAMTEAMKTASVVHEQYGASIEDTATAMTLLAKVNIVGTAAGTSYRNMLKDLYTPTKEAARVMEDLGIKTKDASGKLRDAPAIIADLKTKLQGFTQASQTDILGIMFSERGGKEAIQMLSAVGEEWDTLKAKISNSEGFMAGVTAELEMTTKGRFKQALNTMQANMVSAFDASEGPVRKLADALRNLADSPEFIAGINAIVGVMASLASTVVNLLPTLIGLGEAWVLFKGVGLLSAGITAFATSTSVVAAEAALAAGGLRGLAGAMVTTSGAATAAASTSALGGLAALITGTMTGGLLVAVPLVAAFAYKLREVASAAPEAVKGGNAFIDSLERQNKKMDESIAKLREILRLKREGKAEGDVDTTLAQQDVDDRKAAIARTQKQLADLEKPQSGAYQNRDDRQYAEQQKLILANSLKKQQADLAKVEALNVDGLQKQAAETVGKMSIAVFDMEKKLGDLKSRAKSGAAKASVAALENTIADIKHYGNQVTQPAQYRKLVSHMEKQLQDAEQAVALNGAGTKTYTAPESGASTGAAESAAAAARRRANKDAERDEKATIASYTERQNAEIASLASRAQNKLISEEQNQAELAGIYAKYNDVIAEQYAAGTKRLKTLQANAKADEKDALKAALTEMETAQAKFESDKLLRLQQSKDRELGIIKATGEATKAFLEEQKAQVAAQIESINEAKAKLNMGPGESAAYDAGRKVDAEFRKKEADLKAQINNLRESLIAAQKQASGGDLSEDQIASVEGNKVLQDYLRQLQEVYDAREALKTQAMDAAEANSSYMRSFEFGWKSAYKAHADEAANSASKAQVVFQSASRAMEDAVTQFVTTGKIGWRDLASTVLSEAARVMASRAVASMLGMATNFISGLFSGSSGAPDTGVGSGFNSANWGMRSANGNVFSGAPGLHQYVNTVQDSPKVFAFDRLHKYANGGVFAEAGPEAVMPLARDSNGRLGVRAQGGSGANVAIYLTVNEAEGTTSAKSSGDANGAWAQFATRIKGMILEEMTNQKRPGGLLYA